jgi:hypothetical protein
MTDNIPKILKGTLEAFWETGTEGVLWSFHEDGKPGYDGLHVLEKGDLLRVFNDASRQDVVFEGAIDLEYENRKRPFPYNPKYSQQEIFGYWIHGLQQDHDPEAWAKMFFEEKPAELILRHTPKNRTQPKGP